jgi:preprotein translocase subunit SecE
VQGTDYPKGSGATGSAPVSKTGGWGFESLLPCGTQASDRLDNQVMRTVSSTSSTKKRRGSPALFLRQVVAELRKVVRPTRNELITYTSVVLFFVMVIMLYVSGLDLAFGKLVLWAFGGA